MSEPDLAKRLLPERLLTEKNVIIVEDAAAETELFPLSVLRPSWEIRCGAGCLRAWLSALKLPGLAVLWRPRSTLESMARILSGVDDDPPDPENETLFLNGRTIAFWANHEKTDDLPHTLIDADGRLLFARRRGKAASDLWTLTGNEICQRLVQDSNGGELPEGWTLHYARYLWDYMLLNRQLLERQLISESRVSAEILGAHTIRELPAGVHVTDRTAGHPVYAGQGVRIMPGVVFGNHTGPVWIGAQTEIEPHCYLEGPLYVGPYCRIKSGTRLYHGSSIGPYCRIAGEISETIMQGYVNKQHDGFVGNSIFGHWVNLGADTVTSNLKNDYSVVKVQVGPHRIDTRHQFIGLMCGDHTKTGINTMFNTGTVVGVGTNVYGGDYPPRFIPSFMWGGASGLKRGDLDRILFAARAAMPRRGQTLSGEEERLLRQHYAETLNQETAS